MERVMERVRERATERVTRKDKKGFMLHRLRAIEIVALLECSAFADLLCCLMLLVQANSLSAPGFEKKAIESVIN
jgi:hypothetical protein